MRAVSFSIFVIIWTLYIWQLSDPTICLDAHTEQIFTGSVSAVHVHDSMVLKAQSYGAVKMFAVSDSSFITNIRIGREYQFPE